MRIGTGDLDRRQSKRYPGKGCCLQKMGHHMSEIMILILFVYAIFASPLAILIPFIIVGVWGCSVPANDR